MDFIAMISEGVAAGEHRLPPLPYGYGALMPVIGEETLRIHHDKLHKGYVDNLNKTELALVEARRDKSFNYIQYLEGMLAFNGSGHILHSVYWTSMSHPDNGSAPGKVTSRRIQEYFGDFEGFKMQFLAAATNIQGGGWAILIYNTAFSRLELLQCEKHQNLTQWGGIPILVADVWEHAYYLDYQSDKGLFMEKWWSLINWDNVEQRLLLAQDAKMPMTI